MARTTNALVRRTLFEGNIMPLRNMLLIVVTCVVSLLCYQEATHNYYADIVSETMDIIEDQYVEEVDRRTLFESAMRGMVSDLDRHSNYISPDDLRQFDESLNQEFGGIGIEVEMGEESERLTIVSPLPNTPAFEAGMQAGDVIMNIDGQDTEGMTLEDSVDLMRGKPGDPVELDVRREGEAKSIHFSIKRARIPIESVKGDLRRPDGSWRFYLVDHPRIGYVRLTNFGEDSVAELRSALKFEGHPVDALILDLRGNSGGLLTAAVEICDMFIDRGTIVSTRGRGRTVKSKYEANPANTIAPQNMPMVVMTNGVSASASEIVAACLQDHKRAIVVGERSWGKGTVQNVIRLEGGKSALKLTTASYWRPSGKNIHRSENATDDQDWGVRPNKGFEVKLDSEELERLLLARRDRDVLPVVDSVDADGEPPPLLDDPQLEKAVEYLQQQLAESAAKTKKA
jgi:carboxyl-terminal processing protease